MAGRKKTVSKEEFFEINTQNCGKKFLAESIYILVHTAYLKPGTKVKPLLGDLWREKFGLYMENESFEYLKTNDPVLITDVIVEDSRKGVEITSSKYLGKAIVSLEFDLWMIENYRAKKALNYENFEKYLRKKYGQSMEYHLSAYKKFNLYGIDDLEVIADVLNVHYDEILAFFELLLKNNKMRISIDNVDVERVIPEPKVQPVPVKKPEVPVEQSKPAAKQEDNFEYEIIIKELQERIDKLEKDIKEFKRQRDDAREYSVNQYDKGIKDLFSQMNDVRYGKVIDYFYALLREPDTDENLASYLDNFFMILEDMEIEPIVGDGVALVTESNLTKDYNLDFDKKQYVEGGTEIKYVGWKYKDYPIEKPTLKLKEK